MPESGLQYNIINIVIVTCISVVVLILSINDLFEARPQEDNMTILKKTPLYLLKTNKNRHEKGTGLDSFGLLYLDLS